MKEYELLQLEKGDFQDNFGNTWCTAVFKGIGEPVKWVLKDPMSVKIGETYYGQITEETSKANKPYLRFRRENRPEQQSFSNQPANQTGNGSNDDEYWADKNATIRAQWAIGQAVSLWKDNEPDNTRRVIAIEASAKMFYAMVDRVKDASTTKPSGYEVAKAKADALRTNPGVTTTTSNEAPPHTDEDFQAALGSALNKDEPINIDDIPF